MPAQAVKQILVLYDRRLQNPTIPKMSPEEVRNYFNQFFNVLENSSEKVVKNADFRDYELTVAGFAVVTSTGEVIHVEALSGLRGDVDIAAVMLSTSENRARIDIAGFGPLLTNKPPAVSAKPSLPSVEIDILADQKPGHWAGLRFSQIVQPGKIKRIFLLKHYLGILDYFGKVVPLNSPHRDQLAYRELFGQLEASDHKAGKIVLSEDEERPEAFAMMTDSGELLYLEVVEVKSHIEHGSVVGNHIAGVLIHGPGKGVRINLNILPASSAK